jgi:hypothetical protein
MIIRKPKVNEIHMYYEIALQCSLESRIKEFDINKDYVMNNINAMMRGEYFYVVENEGVPVGWMAASKRSASLYCDRLVLAVDSYQCNLKGRKAVTAMLDIHEHLYDYANTINVEMVLTGSVLNSKKTYNKILKHEGWADYEFMLLKMTDKYQNNKIRRRVLTIAEK